MERILVGMDGSAHAADALRWGVEEGRIRDWPVTAMLAWSMLDQAHVEPGSDFDPNYAEGDAADALDAYVAAAVGAEAAALVGKEVVCDRPASTLLEGGADSSLLVVGPRGLGGFRSLLLGSVSQQCLHHAPCPIAIVRPVPAGRAATSKTIVVGVDGSASSKLALDWGLDEARARRSRVEVVHSWTPPYAYGYPSAIPLDPAPYEEQANRTVASMIAEADTHGLIEPPIPVVVAGGGPAGSILVRAEVADLVVVASRGVGGFRGVLLGSVAHHLSAHSPCPVVVVPSGRG